MSSIIWSAHLAKDADVDAYQTISDAEWPGYPPSPIDPKWWRTPFAWNLGKNEQGQVVGGCRWLRREIEVAGEKHAIAALAGVVIAPEFRGHGIGAELIEFANAFATAQGFAWAVLITGEERIRFYGAAGYSKLEGDIYVTKFDVRDLLEPSAIVMAKPLTSAAAPALPLWERATVDIGHGKW